MKLSPRSFLAVLSLVGAAATASAQPFSFAGVTFDQAGVFTKAEVLGNGAVLGEVTLSDGMPDAVTSRVRFPSGDLSKFDPTRGVGSMALGRGDGLRGLRLPRGGDGREIRHGVRLSFVERVAIVNLTGPDFVVYESGDLDDGPEAFAVRARNAVTGAWSAFYYQESGTFQRYGNSRNGAYSTLFDLERMGFALGDLVDAIEIINLTSRDGVEAEGERGSGKVVFGFGGTRPNPNSTIIRDFVDVNGFDPDILYAASLRSLVPLPAAQ